MDNFTYFSPNKQEANARIVRSNFDGFRKSADTIEFCPTCKHTWELVARVTTRSNKEEKTKVLYYYSQISGYGLEKVECTACAGEDYSFIDEV